MLIGFVICVLLWVRLSVCGMLYGEEVFKAGSLSAFSIMVRKMMM